MALARVWSFVF